MAELTEDCSKSRPPPIRTGDRPACWCPERHWDSDPTQRTEPLNPCCRERPALTIAITCKNRPEQGRNYLHPIRCWDRRWQEHRCRKQYKEDCCARRWPKL